MVLCIQNRTENYKTALTFSSFMSDGCLRKRLAIRLGEDTRTLGKDIKIELFWQGVRDWLEKCSDCEGNEKKLVKECEKILPNIRDDFIKWQKADLRKFGQSLITIEEEEKAYKVSNKHKEELVNNLRNTEIDVILETPQRIYIGEAKYTQDFGSNRDLVLIHQLIRQYIVASALSSAIGRKKEIVPFVIFPRDKLKNWWELSEENSRSLTRRCPAQVRFMIEMMGMTEQHCLTWEYLSQMQSH